MKAISVRAPWWWFILHGGKNIENREWPTRYRGPLLIHASSWWNTTDVLFDSVVADYMHWGMAKPPLLPQATLKGWRGMGGCLVGRVDLVDCVTASDSPWFVGKYGMVLANPVAFASPVRLGGHLGLFDVDDRVIEAVR